jgi:hypothetical protein
VIAALVLAAATAGARAARAYRPFDGTDAAVAETGKFEIEFGPAGYYSQGSSQYLVAPSTTLNFGIVERAELVLQGVGFYRLEPHTLDESRFRVLDTGLFVKVVLREGFQQEKEGMSIATEVGTLLPTINEDPNVGGTWGFIFAQQFGNLVVQFNALAAVTQAHNPDFFGGAIFEGPKSLAVRPVAELFVEREFVVMEKYSALVGAIWQAHRRVDFDAGLRVARINSDGVGEVRLGVTWRLP